MNRAKLFTVGPLADGGERFDWYVDSVNGSDAAAGTSAGTALKTLSALVAKTITAGQVVGLKGTFRETLTVPSSGSAGNPITYKRWGSAATIDGSDVITTFTDTWPIDETIGQWDGSGDLAAGNWMFRIAIPATAITINGTSIEVTLEAANAAAMVVSGCYIGEKAASGDAYDMEPGTISQLLFSGAAGKTIAAGQRATSDELDYAINETKDYIISVGVTSGQARYRATGSNNTWYKANGAADAGTANVSSMSTVNGAGYSFWSLKIISSGGGSQANTWAATCATTYEVWFDGNRGGRKSALNQVTADYDYYSAGGRLYVYSATDPDTRWAAVTAALRTNAIHGNAKNYLTFDGLHLTKTNGRGVYLTGTNGTVQNCTIDYLGGGVAGLGQGVMGEGANTTAKYNTLSYINGTGIAFTGAGALAEYNTVSICWNGLAYPTGDGSGIGISGAGAGTIRYNRLEGNYIGITANQDATVYYNLVINTRLNSINHTNGDAAHPTYIYNNVVIHNPANTSGHGIGAQLGGSGCHIKNNIVYMPYTGTNVNVNCIAITDPDTYTNIEIGYNLLFKPVGGTGDYYVDKNGSYNTLAAWQAEIAGTSWGDKSAHDIIADPLFVGASDYRLQAGSPAIGAGVSVGLTTDYAGAAVGNPPNIGAYE